MIPETEPPHTTRNSQIDMLKGLGICCVVVSHLVVYEASFDNLLVKIIYAFHMPLFFILSGYLSSIRRDLGVFCGEKLRQLMVPYCVYFFGVFLFNKIAGRNDCGWQCILLGGRYVYNYLGVFWFVPVLFLAQQAGNYLLCKFSASANVLIVLAILCVSYLNDYYFDYIKFPHNANVVLAAVPFYFCGFLVRHYKVSSEVIFATVAAIFGVVLVALGYPNYYDMKNVFYGIPFVTFGSAIALVCFLLWVFSKLPHWGFLADIGKASLVIMYLHQGIQIFIYDHVSNLYLPRLVAALLVPLMVYYTSLRWSVTRALLLGHKR